MGKGISKATSGAFFQRLRFEGFHNQTKNATTPKTVPTNYNKPKKQLCWTLSREGGQRNQENKTKRKPLPKTMQFCFWFRYPGCPKCPATMLFFRCFVVLVFS